MKKVGLVLSGGAAFGLAHIGVIKEFEKNNIPIDFITGTSMGALIGGLYAAGISTQKMEEILVKFTRRMIIDLDLFAISGGGLLHGKKVTKFLKSLVGDIQIEDCVIPFRAVASDLNAGEKFVFSKGSLVEAIRASISIPGIFKPVRIGKKVLVDGGACDNLPVGEARDMGAEKVVAIDVCTYYKKQLHLKSTIDIIVNASNLLIKNLVKKQIDKGDIYIKIDQPNVKQDQLYFENSQNAIRNGEKATRVNMADIKKMLGIKENKKPNVKDNSTTKKMSSKSDKRIEVTTSK